MMKLGIAVLGATGYIGTPYREEIRESGAETRIVTLCARRRDRLEAAQQKDKADLITDDWQAALNHPDVNCVVVATPDALHFDPVIACAALDKHVFCEKPVGLNADQAYQIWTAFQNKPLGHFVPFWTRYVPVFARAREFVQSGALGEIRSVIYRWHNPRPTSIPFTWRDDATLSAAGSIADVGSHAYDTIRWIIDQEANRVLAHAEVLAPAKPDVGPIDLTEAIDMGQKQEAAETTILRKGTAFDYANIIWQFHGGVVGSLVLSHAPTLRKGLAPEVELHGTEGSLAIDRLQNELTLVRPDGTVELLETVPNPGFGNRFVKHVFPAISDRASGETSEHPGLYDGWRVQIFTDAVVASVERGAWVALSEFDSQSNDVTKA